MHSRPLGPGLLICTIGAKKLQILGWMQNISIFEIMQFVTKMVWKQKEYFALPFKQIQFSLIVSASLQTNPSFSSLPSFLSSFKPTHPSVFFLHSCLPPNQLILQFSSFIPVYLQTNPSFSSLPSFLSTFNQPILQLFFFYFSTVSSSKTKPPFPLQSYVA